MDKIDKKFGSVEVTGVVVKGIGIISFESFSFLNGGVASKDEY